MDKLALFGGKKTMDNVIPNIWPNITSDDIFYVTKLLERGEISYNGREGELLTLEDKFTEYLGVKYGLATSSGTAAIHSALFGIGLTPGDEVIAPTYTFLATVMPIFTLNAIPVLIDVDRHTGNIDPAKIEASVTTKTKAIIVTHLSGFPVDMKAVMSIADKHNLYVIEDCSQAHGAICEEKMVGSYGHAAAFSLQAKKLVPAGEGGIMVTSDQEIYERANLLGHFRERCIEQVKSQEYRQFASTGYGLNYRIHPIGAALANRQFDRLEKTIEIRKKNCEYLSEILVDLPGIRPPEIQEHMSRVVYYSYQPSFIAEEIKGISIKVFIDALQAEGLPVTRPSSPPLHCEPVFRTKDPGFKSYGSHETSRGYRSYSPGELPISENYVSQLLRFPVYSHDAIEQLALFGVAIEKVLCNIDSLINLSEECMIGSNSKTTNL